MNFGYLFSLFFMLKSLICILRDSALALYCPEDIAAILPLNSRRAVFSYWRKYVHEVLVNCLGGLSLPRKSVVRLTDRPDMTLDVYRGRKTTIQQQQNLTIDIIHCHLCF